MREIIINIGLPSRNTVLNSPALNIALSQQSLSYMSQQTQNICITFIQRRPSVFDVGPALYKIIQMFCVYWGRPTYWYLQAALLSAP